MSPSDGAQRVDCLGALVSDGDALITQRGELLRALAAPESFWKTARVIAVAPYYLDTGLTYRPSSMLVRIERSEWPARMTTPEITKLWTTLTVTKREEKRLELRQRRLDSQYLKGD